MDDFMVCYDFILTLIYLMITNGRAANDVEHFARIMREGFCECAPKVDVEVELEVELCVSPCAQLMYVNFVISTVAVWYLWLLEHHKTCKLVKVYDNTFRN